MSDITITLPQIIAVEDYHEFNVILSLLEKMSKSNGLAYSEVGFNGSRYLGVFYTGTITPDVQLLIDECEKDCD